MIITSTKNEIIKQLKKLMTNKSLAFLDNPKIIQEAILAGNKLIYLIKKEGFVGRADYGGEVIEVSENVFNIFTSTIASQGLIGVVEIKNIPIKRPTGNFLVLDNVQDPGNVGTLIRSALGANFLDIYLLDSCKYNNDKTIRSSMGAVFKTRIYQTTLNEFLLEFKKWNVPLYVCDMEGENIYTSSFNGTLGIVVGNEGSGVRTEVRNIATNQIKIPMMNNLESLNAGVSGSIIMYQINSKKGD